MLTSQALKTTSAIPMNNKDKHILLMVDTDFNSRYQEEAGTMVTGIRSMLVTSASNLSDVADALNHDLYQEEVVLVFVDPKDVPNLFQFLAMERSSWGRVTDLKAISRGDLGTNETSFHASISHEWKSEFYDFIAEVCLHVLYEYDYVAIHQPHYSLGHDWASVSNGKQFSLRQDFVIPRFPGWKKTLFDQDYVEGDVLHLANNNVYIRSMLEDHGCTPFVGLLVNVVVLDSLPPSAGGYTPRGFLGDYHTPPLFSKSNSGTLEQELLELISYLVDIYSEDVLAYNMNVRNGLEFMSANLMANYSHDNRELHIARVIDLARGRAHA